jgi:hypothetical protein
MAKIRRPKTAMGIAVAVAVEALRHPQVQAALRQAPGAVASWRKSLAREGETATSKVKKKVTGKVGHARLVRRSKNLRALLIEPEIADRLGPDTTAKMIAALDSIDLELKIVKQQDLRDRVAMERKIGRALGELVDGLSGESAST